MTVDDYEVVMRRRLFDSGFIFDRPDPLLAWAVFKEFAIVPVECHDSYLFWEAASYYFDFVREFRHYPEDGNVWGEQVTVHFTCSPPNSLDIEPVVMFSTDHADLESFFRAVEARPEFVRGLAFSHWVVELRIDGC